MLLVMGETMRMETERLEGDVEDRGWEQIHRARPMVERLERAFDAAAFAEELRGTARAR
ncbi:MAG: hypothetical protein JST08_00160 [Actinobacteria bacterium]|nr:hypothetical protein [Actinomycetota bacterium]